MLLWTYYLLLATILLFGWAANLLGLPGLWAMVLGHVAFAAITGWNVYVGWPSVTILLALALLAEAAEFFAGAAGSKKAGGSRRGMIGAIVGGFVGGLIGSFLIPVIILGTVAGAVGGSFIGAAIVEWVINPDEVRAAKIGFGAAKGRLLGIILKSTVGLVMAAVSLIAALPLGPPTPPAPAPAIPPALLKPSTAPSTAPATTPATAPSTLPKIENSL